MKTSEHKDRSQYDHDYYKANKDKILAKRRQRAQENKDAMREKRRLHRLDNIEKFKERDRKYRIKNADKIRERVKNKNARTKDAKREYNKRYYRENRELMLEQKKQQYHNDRDEHLKRNRSNYHKHRDKRKEYAKASWEKTKNVEEYREKRREYRRKSDSKRIANNPAFKIRKRFSAAVYNCMKVRKNGSCFDFVDYDLKQLMRHLEKQFTPEMTWDNYGSYWHVDHIDPVSFFNIERYGDAEFRRCWALTNLRPLEAKANLSKGDKPVRPFQIMMF